MPETTTTIQLPDLGPAGVVEPRRDGQLDRLGGVTVELSVEVGRTRMTLGEALALGPGSVVTLDQLADQPVDLLVNGRRIARGEVVVVDEQFGVRITDVPGVVPGVEAPVAPAPAEGCGGRLTAGAGDSS